MLEQPNVLLVKQSLAVIKITVAAIHRCFFKKAKNKDCWQNAPKLILEVVDYSG